MGVAVGACVGAAVGAVVGCAVCCCVGDGVADAVAVAVGDALALGLALALGDGLAATTVVGVGAALVAAGRVTDGCPSGVGFPLSSLVCCPWTHDARNSAAVNADTSLNNFELPPFLDPPSGTRRGLAAIVSTACSGERP